MKNILKVSLLALIMGVASCDNATDIVQESELQEDNSYQTVDDLRSGLFGVYSVYAPDSGGNGDGDIIVFNDLFTDNIKKGGASTGQGNGEYSFILQPTTPFPNTLWGNRYGVINFANRVLRAWERIYPTLTDASDIQAADEIKAQLLAFRALCHFELLSYFATDYQDLDAPGVINMDFVPANILDVYPRNTVGESWDFINEDIQQATLLMGDSFESSGDYTNPIFFLNPDAIKAINARIALFQGDYEKALSLAEAVLDNHALATKTQYPLIFFNDDIGISELIFSLSRSQADDRSILSLFFANTADASGSPFYEVSNELYNSYDPNDIRRQVVVNEEGGMLLVGKYRGGIEGKSRRMNDFKMLRASEMKLIQAEAMARLGNLVDAANEIEVIRDRRVAPSQPQPVYANLQEALTDILLERRRELAFEGHRYLDLKRIGQELGLGIDRDEQDCASFQTTNCFLPAGDYRFTLPIPRAETGANPTIIQNPGY